jgi:ABC-2 type transport system permease protein
MKPSAQGIALMTIIRKESYRIIRIWPQTLLPSVITMSLYFLIFGHVIGKHLSQNHGVPYMQYIAPGLIMMAVINNAYSNVSSSFFSAKFGRSVEEMLVAPMRPLTIIAGFVTGGMIRGVLVGLLVAIVATMFTHAPIQHWGLTITVMVLSALLFSLAGLLNAFFANSFDDISIIPTFILTPLTYLGGVFYSVALLPSIWRQASLFNPVLYLVNAFRYGMLGISDINVAVALTLVLACIAILMALCWWCLHTGKGLRS